MLRKHIKIEPDRWYYHCDRLGMLVWQDMVSGGGEYRFWTISTPLVTGIHKKDSDYLRFSRNAPEGTRCESPAPDFTVPRITSTLPEFRFVNVNRFFPSTLIFHCCDCEDDLDFCTTAAPLFLLALFTVRYLPEWTNFTR